MGSLEYLRVSVNVTPNSLSYAFLLLMLEKLSLVFKFREAFTGALNWTKSTEVNKLGYFFVLKVGGSHPPIFGSS